MIEREMKFLVEQTEFERLLTLARELYPDAPVQVIEQTNYYYDSEDLVLFRQGTTLRVREIGGKFMLERKENLAFADGVRTARETTQALDKLPESVDGYGLLGNLRTIRTRLHLSDGTKLDFDVSRFLETTDYEIEVEIGDAVSEGFVGALPAPIGKSLGKYERFLSR